MNKLIFLIMLTFTLMTACGLGGKDTRYFLRYDPDKRVFSDAVSKGDTEGISYYMVHFKSGDQIDYYKYFEDGKLVSKHINIFDDEGNLVKRKNFDNKKNVMSIEFYSETGLIKKIVKFTKEGKVQEEELYNELQEKIREEHFEYDKLNKKKSLLTSKTVYIYREKKSQRIVTYYKYFLYKKKLHRAVDYIHSFKEDRLFEKEQFKYNKKGKKQRSDVYRLGQLYKSFFYDIEGKIEEEHEYNEKNKVISKVYYDKIGKVIKKVRVGG